MEELTADEAGCYADASSLLGQGFFTTGYESAFSDSGLDCSSVATDNGKGLEQVSLLEIVEDIMRGQRSLKHPVTESGSLSYTSLQEENHEDSHVVGGGQCRRFCVNIPYIPLNLEVPLPTLYAFTLFCFGLSHFLFRDFDDFK